MSPDGPEPPVRLHWVRRHAAPLRRAFQAGIALLTVAGFFLLIPADVYDLRFGPGTVVVVLALLAFAILARVALSDLILDLIGRKYASFREQRSLPGSNLHANEKHLAYYDKIDEKWSVTLSRTVSLLIDPASFTARVSENFEIEGRRWRRDVSRSVRIESFPTVVPIARLPKDEVLGTLLVEADGKRRSTLGRIESLAIVVYALDGLWDQAIIPSIESNSLRERVLDLAVQPEAPVTEDFESILEQVQRFEHRGQSELQRLSFLLRIALQSQVIFVEVRESPERYCRIKMTTYPLAPQGDIRGLKSRFRAALGLSERAYTFSMAGATESGSYHFGVHGPEGMHVYSCHPFWSDLGIDAQRTPPASEAGLRRYVEEQSTGTQHIHVYMRGFHTMARPDSVVIPALKVRFRETPPGILGPALLVSAWVTFLVWMVGAYYDRIFPSAATSPANTSGVWVTLLFGAQAVVVGWLVSKMSPQVLRALSIPTFLIVMWLVFNTAAVFTIVALKSAGIDGTGIPLQVPLLGQQNIRSASWVALMASSALQFSTAAYAFVSKNIRYASLVNGNG